MSTAVVSRLILTATYLAFLVLGLVVVQKTGHPEPLVGVVFCLPFYGFLFWVVRDL